LIANIGDIIEFQFFPPNHSVVRAEYGYPCIPYELISKKPGFFSGFYPVDQILSDPPKWHLRINDTLPIFLYCSAPGSCINYQMVGVINPVCRTFSLPRSCNPAARQLTIAQQNASVSLATQKEDAKNSNYMLQPGDPFPGEAPIGSSSLSSSTSSATAAPATGSAAPGTSGKSGLPAGAIAGIVIGAVAILALAAGLFFYMGRSKSLKETVNRQSMAPSMASFGAMGGTGHLSPASPAPPPMSQGGATPGPLYGPDGTMYVPVKTAHDMNQQRSSLPPYGNGVQSPSISGDGFSTNGSPQPGYVSVGQQDMGTTAQPPQRFVYRRLNE
jgi:hypothetical protein